MRPTQIMSGAWRQVPVFVRGRWGIIAIAAVSAGAIAATGLKSVQAHDERAMPESIERAGTAELLLPQLKPGTYRLIVRKSEDSELISSFKRLSDYAPVSREAWRDRSPRLRLRMPDEPAPVRVAKPAFKVRAPADETFAVPKNFAMIDAPRRVIARKRFEAGWSGPNVSGDRLELVARNQRACESSVLGISVHEYDSNRDGQFTFLAPMRSGDYELVYCSADQRRVLARHPIRVVEQVASTSDRRTFQRLRPAGSRVASRPSFELNSSVDDDRLPRVRMMAPIASARADSLEDDRTEPVFTVRPTGKADRLDRDERVVTPVGRYRFNDRKLAQNTEPDPFFSVRPGRFQDDDTDADDRDVEEVVDIAPRTRSVDRKERAGRTPRIRIFVDEDRLEDDGRDEERVTRTRRPKFDDDDPIDRADRRGEPEPDQRQARRQSRRFFDDEPLTPRRTARRPVFGDDDLVRPRRRSEEKPKRTQRPLFDDEDTARTTRPKFTEDREREDSKRTASRPSFDDEDDRLNRADSDRSDTAFREDTENEDMPLDRADDFKSDEVGVAAAIARNRARYGDGSGEDDEFFTIKGRYNWYKPVTAPTPRRTTSRRSFDADDEERLSSRQRERDRIEDRRDSSRTSDRDETREVDSGRLIELKGRDDFEAPRRPTIQASKKPIELPRERDLDAFADDQVDNDQSFASTGSTFGEDDDAGQFGPPVRDGARSFASRNTDDDRAFANDDFSPSGRTGPAPTGPIEMVRKSRRNQVAPQFDRIQPVKAGYRFAAGWTGDIRNKGWIAVARADARLDDYLSLQAAGAKGELKFRAPSEPGRYELRFLSRDRRVVMARQSFEVEAAAVRLVALEFVDPADDLNVWWAGPGDGSDSLTLARVGTRDTRYLSKQSVGQGNPLKLKAPTQPGTYEMRYINGTDNRVLFRRKLVVAQSQPTLLGP